MRWLLEALIEERMRIIDVDTRGVETFRLRKIGIFDAA
jgi:hypothetical protein